MKREREMRGRNKPRLLSFNFLFLNPLLRNAVKDKAFHEEKMVSITVSFTIYTHNSEGSEKLRCTIRKKRNIKGKLLKKYSTYPYHHPAIWSKSKHFAWATNYNPHYQRACERKKIYMQKKCKRTFQMLFKKRTKQNAP